MLIIKSAEGQKCPHNTQSQRKSYLRYICRDFVTIPKIYDRKFICVIYFSGFFGNFCSYLLSIIFY